MDDTEHGYSLHKEVRCLTLDTQEGSLLPAMSVLMFGPSSLGLKSLDKLTDSAQYVMQCMPRLCDTDTELLSIHSPGSLSKGTPLQLTTRTSWLFCFGFCNRRRRCHDLATDEELPPPEGAEKSRSS